jgi:hypothetical protein
MLKAPRKPAIRSVSLFFIAGGSMIAMFLASQKLFNDAQDQAAELQDLKRRQEQQQQQQQQQQQLWHSTGNQQISSSAAHHESELERDLREFQEFKRFQAQKRTHEQQQAAGVSESKAP